MHHSIGLSGEPQAAVWLEAGASAVSRGARSWAGARRDLTKCQFNCFLDPMSRRDKLMAGQCLKAADLRGAMTDRKFRVVVAGAGVAGLFMAETLRRAGIDFTVYEKAGEVGGTWRDNTFPGLFVDVLSRQYEFPFAAQLRLVAQIRAGDRDSRLYQESRVRPRPDQFIRFNEEISSARFTRRTVADRDRHGPPGRGRRLHLSPPASCTSPSAGDPGPRQLCRTGISLARAGTIACRTTASVGASSAAAPAACRSPRRWPGPDAMSRSSSAAPNGCTFATTRMRPCGSG